MKWLSSSKRNKHFQYNRLSVLIILLKCTKYTNCCGATENARPDSWHRETIKIVRTDTAKPDNAAPYQTVVLEHGWIQHAER